MILGKDCFVIDDQSREEIVCDSLAIGGDPSHTLSWLHQVISFIAMHWSNLGSRVLKSLLGSKCSLETINCVA